VAELARYEAALRSAGGEAEARALGAGGDGWRLCDGVEVHRFDADIVALAERVDAGEAEGRTVDGRLTVAGPLGEPTGLVIGRDPAGELVIVRIPPELCDPIRGSGGGPATVPADVRAELSGLGLAAPLRWG
jgi:hypothetical protein